MMRMRVATCGLAAVMLLSLMPACLADNADDPRYRPITIRLRDVSLRAALDMLLRETGLTYQLPRDIEGERVTVDLRDLPLEQALHAILTAQGLTYRYLPDAKLYAIERLPEPVPVEPTPTVTPPEPVPVSPGNVTPPTGTGETVTRVIGIRYGDVADIAAAFGGEVIPYRLQGMYGYGYTGVPGGYGTGYYGGYGPYGTRRTSLRRYSPRYTYGGAYGNPPYGSYGAYGPYGGYGVGYGSDVYVPLGSGAELLGGAWSRYPTYPGY